MYQILRILSWILVILTIRFERKGIQNVPLHGSLLVVANHMSVSDPVLLGIGLRRRIIFLAKEELFRNIFSAYFVRQFGAIQVFRGRSNRDALHKTGQVLASGGAIGMFPEGQRSKEGKMISPQFGSALIAYHNRVAVLPVGISGTEVIRGMSWIWRRPRVVIQIGSPFYLPEGGKALNREQLAEYSDMIMHKIAVLVPEKYRGQYQTEDTSNENKNN
ncbi:MAG TPA: lysophospholipid acyltransferase family protein [Dehalococcoidales bacterium]|nr:lysophospholipid acyltransferase family protein [Dehalococcoidales bacterium]